MIHGELARHAEQLVAERVPSVHATVVRARRPTSVRPGDAAIVHADGTPYLEIAGERVFFCSDWCRDGYAEHHTPNGGRR